MCERCNPLGLKAPSASQAHGTAALGIVVAVVVLAVVARLAMSGVGPFTSSVAGVAADPAGLRVTITVTNAGSSAGSDDLPRQRPEAAGHRARGGVRVEPDHPARRDGDVRRAW